MWNTNDEVRLELQYGFPLRRTIQARFFRHESVAQPGDFNRTIAEAGYFQRRPGLHAEDTQGRINILSNNILVITPSLSGLPTLRLRAAFLLHFCSSGTFLVRLSDGFNPMDLSLQLRCTLFLPASAVLNLIDIVCRC